MEEKKQSLDDVLETFSMRGRYHLEFMVYAMYMFACSSLSVTAFIFVGEEVGYRCADEGFDNNSCEAIDGMRCTKWIYDDPHSFVAEFDLACQDWKRTFLGTAHMVGYMVGLLVVGPVSDRIGRKMAVVLTGILGASVGLAQSFCRTYWGYVFMEALVAMFGDWYSPLFMLNLEIVPSSKRVIYHLVCSYGSNFGSVMTPVLAWAFPYYRHFIIAVYLPAFLIVFAYFLIDESPRWLLAKRRRDKAIAVVERMSKKNKTDISRHVLNNIVVEDDKTKDVAFIEVLKMTLRSRTLLKRFLVCVVWWITSTFVTYGTLINSVSLQGNKYVNYALMCLTDVPGNLLLIYIMNNYKRKISLISTFVAAAVLFFIHPLLPKDIPWLSVTVYMASKLMNSFYFSITYIYTSELFPTYTRNSMHATCSAIGRIGAMIAPQTPLLMVYWSELPTLLFGLTSLIAGLVTLLVPDTARAALPDTVTQAERIGDKTEKKDQSMTGIENPAMSHSE